MAFEHKWCTDVHRADFQNIHKHIDLILFYGVVLNWVEIK